MTSIYIFVRPCLICNQKYFVYRLSIQLCILRKIIKLIFKNTFPLDWILVVPKVLCFYLFMLLSFCKNRYERNYHILKRLLLFSTV